MLNVPCVAESNYIHVDDIQAWTVIQGSRRLRLQEFIDKEHMKVVRLWALRADRLNLQDHNAAGSINPLNPELNPLC